MIFKVFSLPLFNNKHFSRFESIQFHFNFHLISKMLIKTENYFVTKIFLFQHKSKHNVLNNSNCICSKKCFANQKVLLNKWKRIPFLSFSFLFFTCFLLKWHNVLTTSSQIWIWQQSRSSGKKERKKDSSRLDRSRSRFSFLCWEIMFNFFSFDRSI